MHSGSTNSNAPVSYTHLDVYKRQDFKYTIKTDGDLWYTLDLEEFNLLNYEDQSNAEDEIDMEELNKLKEQVTYLVGLVETLDVYKRQVFNAVKNAIQNNQPAIERLHNAFDNVRNSIVNAFSGNGTELIQTLANVVVPNLCNSLVAVMNIASGVISAASTLSPVIAGIAGAVTAYRCV